MIKVRTSKLHAAVAAASKIVGAKATMPVLSTVQIRAVENRLQVCSTNLDLSYVETIPCETSELTPEAVCLAGRRLAAVLGAVDGAETTLKVGKGHQTKVACGSSNFNLLGIGPEEFPPLPEYTGASCKLSTEEVAGLLDAVAPAMSTDETRFVLNGAFAHATPTGLAFVATDGRRLHCRNIESKLPDGTKAIIPAKAINMLSSLIRAENAKEIEVWFAAKRVTFRIAREDGEVILQSKLVDGNFPNYQQVIPRETGIQVGVDRGLFLAAIKRVALVTTEKSNSVRLTLKGEELKLSASSPDLGSAEEVVAVKAPADASVQVAMNPEFLISAIASAGREDVQFYVRDDTSPFVVKDERFIAVVMPVRLS